MIIIIGILIVLCIYFYLDKEVQLIEKEIYKECELTEDVSKIKVEIKGAVLNPGVYEMTKTDRVIDLINVSGGLLENANTNFINKASVLKDESVIKIYTNEEINDHNKVEVIYEYIEKECECPVISNDACLENDNKSDKLININQATKEDLLTLSGIGDAKANSIIEYRINNGEFSKIEDIKNVSGISENLFEKIKEFITV